MSKEKFDFSGYATKNDLKCSDGRVILKDAFKDNDGTTVPLVWQHMHNEPGNVLGHALLENRQDGVYTYCKFNDTPAGKNAKLLVLHGDITALSIYANGLVEKAKNVAHGIIREVSLVLAGANPGALIDNLSISHADGSISDLDDEAIIYTGLNLDLAQLVEIKHADEAKPEPEPDPVAKKEEIMEEKKVEEKKLEHADPPASEDETVGDVFNTLTEKQKTAVYAMMAELIDGTSDEEGNSVQQSNDEGDENTMKHNVFDTEEIKKDVPTLTHDQFQAIAADAMRCGSFKEAFEHAAATYGIENVDYLFPDAQNVTGQPSFIKRDTGWVAGVMTGTYHTPFSRLKTTHADITAEAARALGYVKGSLKKEEVIRLLKRVTSPTTVYKKQKLDRDDILDITDLDVVAWLKSEMRVMLDEEIARAILIGDGRAPENPDKINEENIRPIWTDDDMYAHHIAIAADAETDEIIDQIVLARKNYKGSGDPAFYTTTDTVANMMLLKDSTGRRIYNTMAELESALRVSKVVEVPVMENQGRTTDAQPPVNLNLIGILVNLKDYAVGSDKGGAIGMFDDFDIDYNQYKYLMETRCSGALTLPKSALVFEQVVGGPV